MEQLDLIEDSTPAPDIRAKILELEATMLQMTDHLIDLPLRHIFTKGMYAREITIPAGVTLTGKIHRTDHINVLSKGDITVWTEEGMKRIQAPYTFVAKAGTKRVGYAHTEVVWTTFHATEETDLDKLEAELIAPSFEALEGAAPQTLIEEK